MIDNSNLLNHRYRLIERLGSGGMAEVFRAEDLTLERTVAIKLLRKDYSQSADFRARFHHEAKAAANLSHPNIVTVHDFGYSADQLFIVMEYVPGEDLKTLCKSRDKFTIPDAIALITQACLGLGYAHRAGLVHCDVKPQNLLVTPDSRVKVVDFGIARALETISPDEKTDVVWGSPQYFSPEQAAGSAPSPASDVYSLGIILFEMLTGRLPFNATNPQELARLHREALPPSPRRFNPQIPPALELIILKILSKEPSSRYRTAEQLGRVLKNFSDQPPAIKNNSKQPTQATQATTVAPVMVQTYARPVSNSPNNQRQPSSTATVEYEDPDSGMVYVSSSKRDTGFDWITWTLALLVFLTVGGLIPFWLWVYYNLNPPV